MCTATCNHAAPAAPIHCFEKAGLGKAPFRFVGMVHQPKLYGQAVVGYAGGVAITTKPGTSCDFCGTYIINIFQLESADGKRFVVGCDCVRKTGDAGLIRVIDKKVAEMTKARKAASAAEKAAADKALCETFDLLALSHLPHPTPFMAAKGMTLADWSRWMLDHKLFKSLAVVLRRHAKA